MSLKDFFKIIGFPLILFIFHLATNFMYNVWPLYDMPMHFLGGFSIAFMGFEFYKFYKIKNPKTYLNKFALIVVLTLLTCSVAVFWEFSEFFSDKFFNTFTQISLVDTISDLALGTLGGLISALINTKFRKFN